jgi:hypothetical protein
MDWARHEQVIRNADLKLPRCTNIRLLHWEHWAFAGLLVVLAACNARSPTTSNEGINIKTVRVMGDLYAQYVIEHRNQTPPNEAAFREFLSSKEEILQKVGLTVDTMFVSPRNGQSLSWIYKSVPPKSDMGIMFFGYETAPSDGKRLVISNRGMYELMDDAKFRTVFPNAPK